MSWHILGAGSLGGLWAARLMRAGIPATLILRNAERLSAYQACKGLSLIEQNQTTHLDIPAQLAETDQPISHLLLACKAYDALSAVQLLAPRFRPDTQILLLQNGLGSQDQVRQAVPQARCIALSSTEGAYRQKDFQIVFAGAGDNWLGDGGQAPSWLEELSAAGIPHQWCNDIETRLWRKFAINCAINPLTVLLDCRNGELLQQLEIVQPLCAELTSLLTANKQPQAAEGLYQQVQNVMHGTGANLSSMLQDVRAGRRTEINYLLGYAYQQAQQLSLDLPLLNELYQRLRLKLQDAGLPDY